MPKRTKTATKGLYRTSTGIYEADKRVSGISIRRTTGTSDYKESVEILNRWVSDIQNAKRFGQRPARFFEEMAVEFIHRNQGNATIASSIGFIKRWRPYLEGVPIHQIHEDHLAITRFRKDYQDRKNKTINAYIEILRRMLNQAQYWRDESGLTWLDRAPKFKILPLDDARPPYPITWEDQDILLQYVAPHHKPMIIFALNSGIRDWGLCNLKWDWERESDYGMAFEIAIEHPRQKEKGLVICNSEARKVVESQRGIHPEYVFTYKGKPIKRVVNTAWVRAREVAGFSGLHFHDLRHTYGYRLRSAGVDEETRSDLLRHDSKSITTHYSAADLKRLFDASESVLDRKASSPALRIRKRSFTENLRSDSDD